MSLAIGVDSGELANRVTVKLDHESKFEIVTYVFLDFSWIILAVTRFSRGGFDLTNYKSKFTVQKLWLL